MTKPEPAQADNKDWTWVLSKPCSECGADVSKFTLAQIAELTLKGARRWVELLNAPDNEIRQRPKPGVWSTLEYACHVRDVYRLFLERLNLMLKEDNPVFANWDPNITAESERYDLADPVDMAEELMAAAELLAASFAGVTGDQLGRTGRRSDGAKFTVESFARYELHDPEHHLWDVTGVRSQAC